MVQNRQYISTIVALVYNYDKQVLVSSEQQGKN